MNSKIELNISEINLDGFPNVDRKTLAATIEMELTNLINQNDWPSNFSNKLNLKNLDFGSHDFPQHSGPRRLGKQIAKSIYSGFGKSGHVRRAQTKPPATPGP